MAWQDELRKRNAEKLAQNKQAMTPEELERWIKAAEELGCKIIVGPKAA